MSFEMILRGRGSCGLFLFAAVCVCMCARGLLYDFGASVVKPYQKSTEGASVLQLISSE